MIMTGNRHPFQNHWTVDLTMTDAFSLDVQLYSNGGAFADLSTSVMERHDALRQRLLLPHPESLVASAEQTFTPIPHSRV